MGVTTQVREGLLPLNAVIRGASVVLKVTAGKAVDQPLRGGGVAPFAMQRRFGFVETQAELIGRELLG